MGTPRKYDRRDESEKSDPKYLEQRSANNLAVRRSRAKKKQEQERKESEV